MVVMGQAPGKGCGNTPVLNAKHWEVLNGNVARYVWQGWMVMDMANENQLSRCPFCGAAGEINDGRTYPARCKTFSSKPLAEEWIAEMQKEHVIKEFAIIKKHAKSGSRYTARVEIQAFIPRCSKIGCIGRNAMAMFPSKEAAEAAWNTRMEE